MSTHSPGPWSIANDADGWDNIVDADDRRIAEVDSCSGGKDPDARLIAAAPELLEALELMLSQYGCACGQRGCNRCEYSQIAREAIQKARGEQ
jgi:hypothetical protein